MITKNDKIDKNIKVNENDKMVNDNINKISCFITCMNHVMADKF